MDVVNSINKTYNGISQYPNYYVILKNGGNFEYQILLEQNHTIITCQLSKNSVFEIVNRQKPRGLQIWKTNVDTERSTATTKQKTFQKCQGSNQQLRETRVMGIAFCSFYSLFISR